MSDNFIIIDTLFHVLEHISTLNWEDVFKLLCHTGVNSVVTRN
jgi:hypothetical protein